MKKFKEKSDYIQSPAPIFSLKYWREAGALLFDVRILCIAALLTALRIAVKLLRIPVADNLNITFGFFINALGSAIYGPAVAVVASAVSDFLGFLINPQGTYFPPFMLTEIAGGVVFALFLWRRKLSAVRVIASRFTVTLVCNIIFDPAIMIWYYAWLNEGKSYEFMTIPKLAKNIILFPLQALLLVLFFAALIPALKSFRLISKNQEKPIMTKNHYILIAVMTLLAILGTVAFYTVYPIIKEMF